MNIRKEAVIKLRDYFIEEQRKVQLELNRHKHVIKEYASKRAELKMKITAFGKMISELNFKDKS